MQLHPRVTGTLVCVSLLLGWSGIAWSGPGPTVDLPGLCNASTVVMVGTTRSVRSTGEVVVRTLHGEQCKLDLRLGTVAVRHVLKGKVASETIAVAFLAPREEEVQGMFLWYPDGLLLGKTAILFLRKSTTAHAPFELAGHYGPVLLTGDFPGMEQAFARDRRTDTVETRLAAILAASLVGCPPDRVGGTIAALAALAGENAPKALTAILAHSTDAQVRGTVLTELVRLGDTTHVPEAVEFLLHAKETSTWVLSAKQLLSWRLSQVKDAKLVEDHFVPLLQHEADFVRRNAFYAVRQAESRSLIPYMIKGLRDKSVDVRYDCVMGLTMVNRERRWGTARESFLKNEVKYIDHWLSWWENGGKDTYMEAPALSPNQLWH